MSNHNTIHVAVIRTRDPGMELPYEGWNTQLVVFSDKDEYDQYLKSFVFDGTCTITELKVDSVTMQTWFMNANGNR